jgi:hypothetical protein
VHCGGIATAQLLRHHKLVDAPARKNAEQVSESCQDLQGAAVLASAAASNSATQQARGSARAARINM